MAKGIVESKAVTENISACGILVDLKDKFNTGTRLLLEFNLPNDPSPILISGSVIWQEEKTHEGQKVLATGVEYQKIAAYDMERLNKYICEHMEHEPGNTTRKTGLMAFFSKLLKK